MSLTDFQTYLYPAVKTAKLGFYQKPSSGLPNGQVLEADFSRPDIGATSGATVYDADGNLIELAENVPDWSFPVGGSPAGCPVIKMRPQAQNLFLNSETLATQDVTVTAQSYTVSFKGTGTITFSGAYTGSLVGTGSTESDYVSATFTPSAGTVTCTVSGVVLTANFIAGNNVTSWIPTLGAALTRSSNSFQFTDLVTKGVTGSGGFSLLFNYQNYIQGGVRSIDLKNASGTTIIRIPTNNGGWAVLDNREQVFIGSATAIQSGNFIMTFDGQNVKGYQGGAEILSGSLLDSQVITEGLFLSNGNTYDFEKIAFTPIVLTEAQAIAALNAL